ncbi:MAG: hypothetical protein D6782_12685 [Alphaproteobacteria bacterium]|nr:MAG: hypothetical protein D6782_12685 [Alphaproteobacteria bacterium]
MSAHIDMPSKITFARSLRHCLHQLMDDALSHDLKIPALHLRIAILELDELLDMQASQDSAKSKDRSVA